MKLTDNTLQVIVLYTGLLQPMALSNRSLSSAADQVAEALRLAIFRGEFSPGQAVPQEEIAARFGVSRIPVRDAMNLLQAEGLLRIIPSKGSFVANPSPDEIRETYEIRVLLELEALRLAFRHHNAQTFGRAQRWLCEFDLETEPMRLGEIDPRISCCSLRPRQENQAVRVDQFSRTLSNRGYYLQMSTPTHLKQCQVAHREIFENCLKGRLRRPRVASTPFACCRVGGGGKCRQIQGADQLA